MTREFFLALTPRAAARTRCTCRGSGKRAFPQVYNEPRYKEWLEEAIAQIRALDAPFPDEPYEGDVSVGVEVIVSKPKVTKKRRPKGDRDNFEKGPFDAITQAGGWWKDDDQIVAGPFLKRWAKPDEEEGYRLTVTFLEQK
jgi:Holliday junction resolvase RusA-like endonuclease